MAIYRLGDLVPTVHPDAYVHPEAVVIGDVILGPDTTVWPSGRPARRFRDDHRRARGPRSRTAPSFTPDQGSPRWWETAASSAIWLISKGACWRMSVWSARDRWFSTTPASDSGSTVGANAVVPNNMEVPAGALAVGVPAVVRPGRSSLALIQISGPKYVENGRRYRQTLARLD